jgi:amino acid transporter
LSGQLTLFSNAISFGIEVLIASGAYDPTSGEIPSRANAVGIAIAALTFVILLHVFSRRGGIMVNNAFAVIKVALLVVIILLGIAKAGGALGGFKPEFRENFTKDAFKTDIRSPASWSSSLMMCMYTFSGYEQPFYVGHVIDDFSTMC